WLFNTDETERAGEGAFREMIAQNVIAAWGRCRGTGAHRTLEKPNEGETVFYFLAGQGIIASGQVTGPAYKAKSVFGQKDEYHRAIDNLRELPEPLTVAEIRERTGYNLPCRHIVCRLNDKAGVRFILKHFKNFRSLRTT